MRKRLALAALALGVAGGSAAALGYLLETRAAYRSPLRRGAEARVPRTQALQDLAEHRRRRLEEERARQELLASLTTDKMVELGREIVHGRGLCLNCHSIGGSGGGSQGPDLAGIGTRAGERVPSLSGIEYLAQSLYRPAAHVVDGYAPAMTPANEPPIALDDDEILMVIAYLETLGGEATVAPGMEMPLGLGDL